MKHICIEDYDIVHSGQTWQYEEKPCQKDMLGYLEKNEAVVTWLQPKDNSSTQGNCAIHEQIPCIRVKVCTCISYCSMNRVIYSNLGLCFF